MEVSKAQQNVFEMACASDANVLITGPTGSGKSCLARAIHEKSARRNRPFININLAAMHEGTIESELFGHERGAFTSADVRRVGRLEIAAGGTVFLDEIGELPVRLQARLLEFLQSRVIIPVGSNRETKVDVRVIAATNRDLGAAVRKQEFREDLFHRLRVHTLCLKSLGERNDEFDALVHETLEQVCRSTKRTVLSISPEVANALESYAWPGNLRELRNVFEYAVISANGRTAIELRDLPEWFSLGSVESSGTGATAGNSFGVTEVQLSMNFEETLSRFERQYLELALRRFRGKINRTARSIGMNKTTLIRRMRAYGLYDREGAIMEGSEHNATQKFEPVA